MTKAKRHFRTVSQSFACRHGEEIFAGYESARRVERQPAVIDTDPGDYFAGAKYCLEDYSHLRETLGDSKAFCVGWAVALEEIRDRAAPIRALAELF